MAPPGSHWRLWQYHLILRDAPADLALEPA